MMERKKSASEEDYEAETSAKRKTTCHREAGVGNDTFLKIEFPKEKFCQKYQIPHKDHIKLCMYRK